MKSTPKGIHYDKDKDLINKTIAYASSHDGLLANKSFAQKRAFKKSGDVAVLADELIAELKAGSEFSGYSVEDLASLHELTREQRRQKISEHMHSGAVQRLFADEVKARAFNLGKILHGKEGLQQIRLCQKHIAKLRDEINAIKIDSMKAKKPLSMIDLADIDGLKYAIAQREQKIHDLTERQEIALAERLDSLRRQKKQYTTTGFAPLHSREKFIDKAIDDLTLGQNMLIEGPTGTGKTMIAEEIKQRVVHRLGAAVYTVDMKSIADVAKNIDGGQFEKLIQAALEQSISQGKLQRTISITSDQGLREIPNPLFSKSRKDDTTISGHAGSTNSDYTVKPMLKGHIEVVDQLSKFFRGIHEGIPVILDEIDLVPTEIIMRLKSFFNLKAGDYLYPQEGTQNTKYQIPRGPMIIATMNGRSDKHPDRGRLDPAIMRLFPAHRRLGYLTKDEKYDWALMTLMDKHGSIPGVGVKELDDAVDASGNKTNGALKHFVDFVDELEQCYLGQKEVNLAADGISMKDGQKYLDQKLIETGKLEKILTSWKGSGKTLTQHICDEIKAFIVGATREDAYIMIDVAKTSGFVTKDDIDELSQHLELAGGTKEDITTIIGSQVSTWGESGNTPFSDPYEVALLDPEETRHIQAKHSLLIGDRGPLLDALRDIEGSCNTPTLQHIAEQAQALRQQLSIQGATVVASTVKPFLDALHATNDPENNEAKAMIAEVIQSHDALKSLSETYAIPAEVTLNRKTKKENQEAAKAVVGVPKSIKAQQTAMQDLWPNEVVGNKSLWDACNSLLQDKAFIRYEEDASGDTCVTFPALKLSLRQEYLRPGSMKKGDYDEGKNDYKTYEGNQLMSTMPSSEERNCIYKNTLDTQKPAFKKALDTDCYEKGYIRQTKSHTDTILRALATKLNLTYDATSTSDQQVVKAYMYLKGALGWEWLNTDRDSKKDGNKYGQIDNSPISTRAVVWCNVRLQRIDRLNVDDLNCSVPVLKELG